jgi:ABC-type bacteriocin/lantibiotic exporter with double-glycine peptidase domain
VFLAFAAYRLLPAGQQVFAALARIRAERAGFDGIVDDLQWARRRTTKQPSATAAEWFGRPRQAIRLIDVSYRHSAQRAGGVSGVSLEIAAGTVVGFVGPNGAGKTTLAELVLGLRTPDTGRIEVDGDALGAGNRDAWLDTVAYVPQQIALLDATIAQNIAFDVAPAHLDLERVLEAARAAQLGPLLEAMPDGVATIIGENGARLSGGQRQRIGLARALYRRASLLVVDEGTSALDAMTEADIMALLGALRGRCTVILIAHHTSSLSGCDSLVELDGGQVVGRKTLSDLQALHIARR